MGDNLKEELTGFKFNRVSVNKKPEGELALRKGVHKRRAFK